jgi:DNA-binding NarL/FixJ family response regulator
MRDEYTVVIVDDHAIVRDGLKKLLNASDDLKVIGEAESGLDAIRCIKEKRPDIALLEISMPKMGGISVVEEITAAVPETKCLALTMHGEEQRALDAFRSGIKGFCLKTCCYSELLFAIRSVLSGKNYVSPQISDKILEGIIENKRRLKTKSSWETLTQREIEVLKLVGEGYRSKEIADSMSVHVGTVNKHRENIMQKLDLRSASALTAYSIKMGLVDQ